jgi:Tol biopolymer transport system component
MTGHDNFDRSLVSWFHADALSATPAGGLDHVLDVTRRVRPRPAWLAGVGSRWVGAAVAVGASSGNRTLPRLGLRWSTAFILILVIAALVVGAILVGARLLQPPPVPADSLSHLAYGLDGSIYVADLDGRNSVRIADGVLDPGGAGPWACGSFWGEGPIWSPDGRHLAYRSAWDDASCHGTPGEGQVYIADPDGHLVTSFPGTGWLVSWSPDSTRVATSVDLAHTFGIYGLDGVRQALLTMPPGYELHGDYDPVWSPDGMSLLMPIVPVGGFGPSENWELPIDGGTPRRVPDGDPLSHQGWAYSPDGSHVAYNVETAYTLTGPEETLNVAAADGSQTRVLFTGGSGSLSDPVWSPTGDRLIFSGTNSFRVVDIASGVVASLAIPNEPYDFSVIRFSPEGDRILLSGSDPNSGATSLWSMRADGSDLQLLVYGTDWGDWQPVPTAR